MTDIPKRRWFQFNLKGVFLLLTVLACLSAIVGYWLPRWQRDQKARKMNELIQRSGGYWGEGTNEGASVGLINCRIPKEELAILLKGLKAFDNQTEFHLSGTTFDDSHVNELLGHHKLRFLSLANTGITDDGLKKLVVLKEVEWVNVNNDAITDAGLQYLAMLPKLKYIEVRGTRVTKQGINKLIKTFPTLEVNQYGHLTE